MDHLKEIGDIEKFVSNSPLFKLKFNGMNLYAKLEYSNLMGSIKDRSALFILNNAIKDNLIDENSVIIESTSGNFGIALAGLCKKINLKFIPVIDPNITKEKEMLLEMLSFDVLKVKERDNTGGYLLTRIKVIKDKLNENSNYYNPDQYENPNNYLSYYHTLGKELCNSFSKLDFAFISVSTGGTITGLSLRLKEKFKNIKIIAVDIEGSLVFGGKPQIRKISGLGASMRTSTIDKALIDDVIILSQLDIINGCNNLLLEQGIFAGASSGAVYHAALKTLKKYKKKNFNAVIICPDNGSAYLDTIYNDEWVKANILQEELSPVWSI